MDVPFDWMDAWADAWFAVRKLIQAGFGELNIQSSSEYHTGVWFTGLLTLEMDKGDLTIEVGTVYRTPHLEYSFTWKLFNLTIVEESLHVQSNFVPEHLVSEFLPFVATNFELGLQHPSVVEILNNC